MTLGTRLKWAIFPGINLHARLRYRRLPSHFGRGSGGTARRVLDAGCGNGMLAYRSYLLGNEVLGVSFKESEVAGCRRLFNSHLGIPESRLRFEQGNLYDLALQPASFDEIICAEVLEHLRDDSRVCRNFHRILKPGGILHVCAPNAEHPYNASFPLDKDESGGHVRAGYTYESYQALLEPIGFRIEMREGLGGPIRQGFNRRIKEIQEKFGAWAGVPLYAAAIPSLLLESQGDERAMPFSIYVKARKA